jgi:hypothetical protein
MSRIMRTAMVGGRWLVRLVAQAALGGLAIALVGCGNQQTAGDLHTQHRADAQAAARWVTLQAGKIQLPDPPLLRQGQDRGCAVAPADIPWTDHQFICDHVDEAYALAGGRDARAPLAVIAGSAQAAGWSFLRGTTPGQPQAAIDTKRDYDLYQSDPSRPSLVPITMERSDTRAWVTLELDVVTPDLLPYRPAELARFATQAAGRSIYGFRIDYRYANGTCSCKNSP